jgi:hypothetical protein
MRNVVPQFLAVLAGLSVAPAVPAAGSGSGAVSPAVPTILSAAANLSQNTLVISGNDFGGALPTVRLANQVLEVQSASTHTIVAKLPAGIRPATYRLTVTAQNGERATVSDAFHAVLF